MVINTALKCNIVHNLNISLLYFSGAYILVLKDCVLLWFYFVHILPFILCVSPSILTDPLEQQSVSCESIVFSFFYFVCILYTS